jgi:glycine cleavage system transcriptional repressor
MSSRQWFAIAAIGRDRPGIVADLSEAVYECGCNLEDASMTMLGNEFATLMLVSGTGDDMRARLTDACRRLEWERNLTVFVRPLDGQPAAPAQSASASHVLTAEGVDKAGIVAGVSRLLADHGIHISDLRGRITPVPQSGTPLYTMTARVHLPESCDEARVRADLADVAAKLDVEIRWAAHSD